MEVKLKPPTIHNPWNRTLPIQRTGKARCLWNTYIWTPSLPRGGWGFHAPIPENYDQWSLAAKHAYTAITTPGKRLDSTTEKALFASLESDRVKCIHTLHEQGKPSFLEAKTNLSNALPASLQSLQDKLPNGEEGLIFIPVTTPKATLSSLSKPLQAALWTWRILTIVLVLPWLIYLIKQCIPKYRNPKADADWLWTPGAGHIALIVVPITKKNEALHVGECEYFDSKGLPKDHPENKLAEGEEHVSDLIQEIHTILTDNKIPSASQSTDQFQTETPHNYDYQFQTDTHNCGYWIYMYARIRSSASMTPGNTLTSLTSLTKSIDTIRAEINTSYLSQFLSTYTPQQTEVPTDLKDSPEDDF